MPKTENLHQEITAQANIDQVEYVKAPRAGFWRRIGAIVYDLLVVTAVIMLASGIALAFVGLLTATGLLTLAENQDHASVLQGKLAVFAVSRCCSHLVLRWLLGPRRTNAWHAHLATTRAK